MPFKVSNSSYFSWVVDEHERGRTVEIVVNKMAENIQFDSIIFRKVMIPVRISEKNQGQIVIIATLPSGKSRIPVNAGYIDKPDQLIFHFNNERGVQLLNNITRKDMIYY